MVTTWGWRILSWTNPGSSTLQNSIYGHFLPISQRIEVRRAMHAGCWCISKDKVINYVIQRCLITGHTTGGWPAKTNTYQLFGGLVSWLVGFNCISTFVGYILPNPFFTNNFYFKQFSLTEIHNLIVKIFPFQAIQFIQTVLKQIM